MESYKHETGSFTGKGGIEIFFQKWLVEKAKAVIIIVHGLGEHSGRYENLLRKLSGKKFSVFAIDHRGHGQSDGKKGHIDSFMDYVYDLKLFLEFIKEENKGLPVIIYGHSMGGVIAAKYTMTYPDDLSMLVLSSPAFKPTVKIPQWKIELASFFSSRISSLPFGNGLSVADLSHDAEMLSAYENDPFVHKKITARWLVEFIRAGQECLSGAGSIKKPLLVFHGTEDNIADYRAAEKFYNSVSSTLKKLFLYEGLYHETINEMPQEREKVLAEISGWIIKNIETLVSGEKKVSQVKPAVVKKPAAKKASPAKKAAVKAKSTAKKAPAKKAVVKKAATAAKKPVAKKPAQPAKKTTTKKSAAKKPAVKKTAKKK